MKRITGALLNYIFNEWITHIPCHIVRRGFLRLFNRQIHKNVVVLMHSRLYHFWKLTLEENVVINQYCLLDCRRFPIFIGSNTDIGPYTRIWTLGHDPDSPTHEVTGGMVKIGSHVWVASGVTILPGVNIDDGAVVAAASVVTKNVNRLTIVAGNPAIELRKRNNDLSYELKYKPLFD
jgi:putative colanic acid biosynthesis acetyltransferase WcaF